MFEATNNIGFSGSNGSGAPPPPPLSAWLLDGNLNGAVKSIGTKDAFDFPIITNNIEIARFYANGKFSIGRGASVFDDTGVVIGKNSTVSSTGGIAIGELSTSVNDTVAIGKNASALVNRSIAIGLSAISASQGISIGYSASTNDRGVAIGYSAISTSIGVSIGESASSVGGVSIRGTSVASSQVAIGGSVTGLGLLALGFSTVASGDNGISIGFRSRALATDSIVIGRSVDNATFLDNNTSQSFGIGWSEATPTVLFAKTAHSYISGSGNLAIGTGLTSPSAKLHVKGDNTSLGSYALIIQNANPTTLMYIANSGSIGLNGGAGFGELLGMHQLAGIESIMEVYSSGYALNMFRIRNNGTTPHIAIGSKMYTYPVSQPNYGSFQLNSNIPASFYQLDSNFHTGHNLGLATGHLAFRNGAGGGFYIEQLSTVQNEHYQVKMISATGIGLNMLLSSDANSYLAGITTANLGVGAVTPLSKFEVNGAVGYRSVVKNANDVFDNTFTVMYVDTDATTQTLEDATTCKDRLHCVKLRTGVGTSVTVNATAGNVEGGASFVLTNTLAGVFNQVWFQSDGVNWNIVGR